MGLIRAGLGALNSTLADQWKEFFYCDALDKEVLMVRGQKQTTSRSSNTKGNDNIISNGSKIAVADGQCMLIVEQGKIVEVCAEPGEFIYDTSTEPSIFTGKLGDAIVETFKKIGQRFTLGGDTGKDQRVYYFNTKEIMDNKFGTPNPVPFRVVDARLNLDLDVALRCSGVYSYKIVDPLIFYTNVCANVSDQFTREQIDTQLKTEFVSALQPALAQISALQIRPNEIIAHNAELEKAMNAQLTEKWGELRGIQVVTVAMGSVTLPEADQELIKKVQRAAALQNPNMAAGTIAGAIGDALPTAAANEGGAMAGLMGVGMTMGQGGSAVASLFNAGQGVAPQGQAPAAPAADSWTCECGTVNTGNFCPTCGKKKPETWTCGCGSVNTGNFCPVCGKKKPETWTCECGTVNEGNFCPACGKKKPE